MTGSTIIIRCSQVHPKNGKEKSPASHKHPDSMYRDAIHNWSRIRICFVSEYNLILIICVEFLQFLSNNISWNLIVFVLYQINCCGLCTWIGILYTIGYSFCYWIFKLTWNSSHYCFFLFDCWAWSRAYFDGQWDLRVYQFVVAIVRCINWADESGVKEAMQLKMIILKNSKNAEIVETSAWPVRHGTAY